MTDEFNSSIIFDNIYYLARQRGKKIGELEGEAGVSSGYISRTSKDHKANPGIDFVMRVADSLDVSLDMLLKVKLSEMSPTEQYMANFLDKLSEDTIAASLNWQVETPDELNRMKPDANGYVDHPLFSLESYFEKGKLDIPQPVENVVFTSRTFGVHTDIQGNCYNLSMKNNTVLYLMNIEKSAHRTTDPNVYAIEMWITVPGGGKQFLCSNNKNSRVASLVDVLYKNISEYMKHPRIDPAFKNAIDAYLKNGDLENDQTYEDSTEELPF